MPNTRSPMSTPLPPTVLFVCLGNICRSPLAEAVFRAATRELQLDIRVDSAGTGHWHVGHAPDSRAQALARRHGLDISEHRARQISPEDFQRFAYIVAMDHQNLADIRRLQPKGSPARLSLLLDHVPGREGQDVADPYYGDEADFEATWRDVTAGAQALANEFARRMD